MSDTHVSAHASTAAPPALVDFLQEDAHVEALGDVSWCFRSHADMVLNLGSGPTTGPLDPQGGREPVPGSSAFVKALTVAFGDRSLVYVEGFAQFDHQDGYWHHAWLEDSAGRVLDPSWTREGNAPGMIVTRLGVRFLTPFVRQFLRWDHRRGPVSVFRADAEYGYPLLRLGVWQNPSGAVWSWSDGL